MTRQATAQHFPRSRARPPVSPPPRGPVDPPPRRRVRRARRGAAGGPRRRAADAQAQQKALARKIAEQKALVAQLTNSQAQLAGPIAETRTSSPASPTTSPRRGARSRPHRRHRRRPGDLPDARPSSPTSTSSSSASRLQEAAKKDELGDRKAELADRIRDAYEAERTSLLETFLSGALVHRHARRDEHPARRRRAGPGARRSRSPRTARRCSASTDGRGHARRDQPDPPGDGGPEAEARPAAGRAAEGPGEAARSSRRPPRPRWTASGPSTRSSPPTRCACATRSPRPPLPSASSQHKHQPPRSPSSSTTGNIPSQYNGTLRWPMPRRRDPARSAARAFEWEPPMRRLRALPQRHRPRRRRTGPRSAPRAPAASSTSAGTTPTAPTRRAS